MKVLTLLASIIITLGSCNCQKTAVEKSDLAQNSGKEMVSENIETYHQEQQLTLKYVETTRGFFRSIEVTDKKVSVIRVRDGAAKTTEISDSDWKELMALYQAVNKEGLKDLKAPSEKRFYDGAAIANFNVKVKESEYQSAEFDAGVPPLEIKAIVDKLIAISDKQQ